MEQLASLLAVEKPTEMQPKSAEGCHSRESGNPESTIPYCLGFRLSWSKAGFLLTQE